MSESATSSNTGGIMIWHRIISLGAVGVFASLIISGAAYWAISNLTSQLTAGTLISTSLRYHLESDMMHDALRGDVLSALRAGQVGSADDQQAVRDDLKDHAETIRDRVSLNNALPLPKSISDALTEVGPALTSYIESAEQIVGLALSKSPEAEAQLPAFYEAFGVLEDRMEAVSDLIEGAVGETEKAGANAASTAVMAILISLIAAIAVLVVFVWAVSRQITVPLGGMTNAMKVLAGGDTSIDVPSIERRDEIGAIAHAVQVFKDNAIEKVRFETEEENARTERERLAAADHEREAASVAERQARSETISNLTSSFGDTVEEVLNMVDKQSSDMETSAQSMTEIAKQTLAESVTVTSAAESASASVQTVASAAEQLTASIGEISRQVTHSADISGQAVTAADKTNVTIQELATSAQSIGEVVELINDIANQTNLLALNATIEAARAGDAGKGFAVVASEVKNLASQTAQATEDISAQIGSIQGTTQEAVSAIEGISKTITEMNEIATTIAAAVEEQGAATGDISRNVQDAATGTQNVSSSIGTVKAGSEQTGEASGNLLTVSRELSERFQSLRSDVEEFLTDIKAA